MFVIIRYNLVTENEYIMDVVESYEILCQYIEKIIEAEPTFVRLPGYFGNAHIGYCIPVLRNSEEEIQIERYQFVKEPSKFLTKS